MRHLIEENPFHAVAFVLVLILASLSACDVFKGCWVTHRGHVVDKFSDTDCDSDGDCDTTYYVKVQHAGGVDNVTISSWSFYTNKYAVGSPVSITYREGGLVHHHWFATVEALPANSY